jgi:four helix bundle protein
MENRMKKHDINNPETIDKAVELAMYCFSLSLELKKNGFDQAAGKLRDTALTFYNNLTQGMESSGSQEFIAAVHLARRSLLETAGVVILLGQKQLVQNGEREYLMNELNHLDKTLVEWGLTSLN